MDAILSRKDMTESQRSFELRRFFAPQDPSTVEAKSAENEFDESLNNDGALDAYAETVVWRLRSVHCMVSLIDRGQQYFLAGAVRSSDEETNEVINTDVWFGCTSVPAPGGLCENTLALDTAKDDYPCFIVEDLSRDDRFRNLPVVNGSLASYRFYAGCPITTRHGTNIGSFFMFDDKTRDGLSLSQRKFLHQQATNVMKHLGTKREAAERRRAALMGKGIADFLESSHPYRDGRVSPLTETYTLASNADGVQDGSSIVSEEPKKESVLDQIQTTLDRAATLLRESLEVTAGGVAFFDAGATLADLDSGSYINLLEQSFEDQDPPLPRMRRPTFDGLLRPSIHQIEGNTGRHLSQELIRSSTDKHKKPKVLAISLSDTTVWDGNARPLNLGTLASLVRSYPKGNIWSVDEDGFTTSLKLIKDLEKSGGLWGTGKRRSVSPADLDKQRAEAAILSQIFPRARQIIFLPLWDAGANRWYAGAFLWSQLAMPVFTLDTELAYLSAFTNSVMVEINRLDAVTANKMKSDFIGSISHEFRSPLHGILASAEFLRDSILDHSQAEYVSTIQTCSGTLLDTINHVLDYSKINSFEISGNQQGPVSNELYQVTNLALLCEDVVEGMLAANTFHRNSLCDAYSSGLKDPSPHGSRRHSQHSNVEVVVDIEERDWDFRVEVGALRRIIMNLLGNAQKFTETGYIKVALSVRQTNNHLDDKPSLDILCLSIKDSGKGMSLDFMERKLYQPFAQEDAFTPGVGLGLSIVWTIVSQLGGNIHVRSEPGKGTDVEVTIAVEKAKESAQKHSKQGDLIKALADSEHFIAKIRSRTTGKSVSFSRTSTNLDPTTPTAITWACVERYCDWFEFERKKSGGDIFITDHHHPDRTDEQRILIIQDEGKVLTPQQRRGVASITTPVGPFKLARTILALMDQDLSNTSSISSYTRSDIGTQTPLGSPEERTILNGIIMTDYGFSAPTTVSNTPEPSIAEEISASQQDAPEQLFNVSKPTEMTLRLPLNRGSHPQHQHEPPRVQAASTFGPSAPKRSLPKPTIPSSTSLNILAVDDNAINLQLLHRALLKRETDKIVTAKNGVEAVEAFRASFSSTRQPNNVKEDGFDVIFMDISMPEMDGFEATRLIRSHERDREERVDVSREGGKDGDKTDWRRKKAYVIALTGLASRRDRDEAEECGFDDFLTKPVSFKKIGEVLDRLSVEKGVLVK